MLGAAGLISTPMSSTEFRSYGQRGLGKWITIYAREDHTFAIIAGLRLDTTHTTVTPANGHPAGKRSIGRHAVSTQGIRSGCKSTVVSAVLSGFLLMGPDQIRGEQRTLQVTMSKVVFKSC